jgi:hypothetical protein
MKDTVIFDQVQLTDVLRDIYNNALSKRAVINGIIEKMTDLVKSPGDAVMLAPVIREFIDVGVKSDEQLVKIATIVQRIISADAYQRNTEEDPEGFMSEEEKARLIANARAEDTALTTELSSAVTKIPNEAKIS